MNGFYFAITKAVLGCIKVEQGSLTGFTQLLYSNLRNCISFVPSSAMTFVSFV